MRRRRCEVVLLDKAGERILARSMEAARRLAARRARRSSSTRTTPTARATRYGCHENYLVDRAVPFGALVRHLIAVLRHPPDLHRRGQGRLRGAGADADDVPFQLSQRADFFEEEVGLETTLKRPIVNTRDEPHADPQKYRRLHVIVGDANLCEVATFLKVGTTAIVLAMIEDDFLPRDFALASAGAGDAPGLPRPHAAAAAASWPTARTVTALEMQWELLDRAQKYAEVARPRRGRRRRSAPTCCAAGSRCSPASRPIRCRSPTSSTGWPSTACSTATASATALRLGRRPARGASTCSTTTCGPSSRSPPGSGWSASSTDAEVEHAMRRAARPTPGPTSGASACSKLGADDRGRQLGLAGVRRRRRSAAPGADDGTGPWHARPCR